MPSCLTSEKWAVCAAAWELAAFSFRYPDGELAEAVASGEWAEAAREIAEALGMPRAAGGPGEQLAVCAADVGEPTCATSDDGCAPGGWTGESPCSQEGGESPCDSEVLHVLRAEATRLFVGAPEPVCSPYEGVWRAADDGVQALLFVNPHSMAVERFMRDCGLGRPVGTNEPLDHVATECELLEHLALRAAAPADVEPPEGAPADADLPGGSPEAAYDAFLREHARTWMPRFAEAVAAESRHPFYRQAAAFLGAIMG